MSVIVIDYADIFNVVILCFLQPSFTPKKALKADVKAKPKKCGPKRGNTGGSLAGVSEGEAALMTAGPISVVPIMEEVELSGEEAEQMDVMETASPDCLMEQHGSLTEQQEVQWLTGQPAR